MGVNVLILNKYMIMVLTVWQYGILGLIVSDGDPWCLITLMVSTPSPCLSVTLSHCHTVIHSQTVTLSYCHTLVLSLPVKLWHCHTSHCHTVKLSHQLSHYHTSYCHTVILSHCHTPIIINIMYILTTYMHIILHHHYIIWVPSCNAEITFMWTA